MEGSQKQIEWALKIQANIKQIVSDDFLELVVAETAKNMLAEEGWTMEQIEGEFFVQEAKDFYDESLLAARMKRVEGMKWDNFKSQVDNLLSQKQKASWWIENFSKVSPQNLGDLTKVYRVINPK